MAELDWERLSIAVISQAVHTYNARELRAWLSTEWCQVLCDLAGLDHNTLLFHVAQADTDHEWRWKKNVRYIAGQGRLTHVSPPPQTPKAKRSPRSPEARENIRLGLLAHFAQVRQGKITRGPTPLAAGTEPVTIDPSDVA